MEPTRQSVLKRIAEYEDTGDGQDFVTEYANGRNSRTRFFLHKDRLYPSKPIWAAAHEPPALPASFSTSDAEAGLRRLGFDQFVNTASASEYFEGQLRWREMAVLARNSELVRVKKASSTLTCETCGFDFGKRYGKLGVGYIECHHIDQLSKRNGVSLPTKLDELALLCANCHRMIHRRRDGLTLDELRDSIREPK